MQHWKEGGHDQLCKKIKRAGGAEQYNADQRYAKAVSVAAEKCADDTKGQTCFICTQALHWKTKEGLVRGCSCRGTAGFAHVSCLAEQAKILMDEAEENNLSDKAFDERWRRWNRCSLCEQEYHGVVRCAMGWACWKTYVGRPEMDWAYRGAMTKLGNGLCAAGQDEDALSVREAELAIERRRGAPESTILIVQTNLAITYATLGREEEALRLRRDVYFGCLRLNGEEKYDTLREANNYAGSLVDLERFEEAKTLLLRTLPVARRVFGESHELTLKLTWHYAVALYRDPNATLDDNIESVNRLEDAGRISRRVLGGAHPLTVEIEKFLRESRATLSARDITDAFAAMTPSPRQV